MSSFNEPLTAYCTQMSHFAKSLYGTTLDSHKLSFVNNISWYMLILEYTGRLKVVGGDKACCVEETV